MKANNKNTFRNNILLGSTIFAVLALTFGVSQSFSTNDLAVHSNSLQFKNETINQANPQATSKDETYKNESSEADKPIVEADMKPAQSEENTSSKRIKSGLLLETSSSMDGLINQAQSQLWKIVNELSEATCEGLRPSLEIALYEYGNDGLNAREGYIKMVTPLTNDLDQISSDLFSLTTNGGSEFCGHVIQTATNQLDWGAGDADLKLMFIAGNEGFDQGSVSPKTACTKAKNMGITINTIFCGDINEGLNSGWKQGADYTAGHFMSISHNTKTVYIETPYDDDIEAYNSSLNDTYIPYGNQGQQKKSMQLSEDANSESYGRANKVSRIISKNSHVYHNATWDLVDAYDEKDFDISNIENKTLPKEMQTMGDDDKVAYILRKKQERSEINMKILNLNKDRMKYISAKKKETETSDENSLDIAMIKAIKEQAARKAFTFEN